MTHCRKSDKLHYSSAVATNVLEKSLYALFIPLLKQGKQLGCPPREHCLEHFRESSVKLSICEFVIGQLD